MNQKELTKTFLMKPVGLLFFTKIFTALKVNTLIKCVNFDFVCKSVTFIVFIIKQQILIDHVVIVL